MSRSRASLTLYTRVLSERVKRSSTSRIKSNHSSRVKQGSTPITDMVSLEQTTSRQSLTQLMERCTLARSTWADSHQWMSLSTQDQIGLWSILKVARPVTATNTINLHPAHRLVRASLTAFTAQLASLESSSRMRSVCSSPHASKTSAILPSITRLASRSQWTASSASLAVERTSIWVVTQFLHIPHIRLRWSTRT